jgi:hypothetical protein
MADTDVLIAGLSELADLYTKSKALDLAETQFQIQREGAIADRALQERQINIAENKAISTEKLAELQINMTILNDLKSTKRSQEQSFEKAYGVSPIYQTSGVGDIASVMQGGIDNKISGVGELINALDIQLGELSTQRGQLQAEETYYTDVASQYTGLNTVLDDHEFQTLVTEAKELPQFKDSTGAGFRAAYAKEGSPMRRKALSFDMTNKMKKESSDLATIQYSAMQTMTNANEDFDWEANFGSKEMADAAKEALASSDYKYFLSHINMPGNEAIRNIFRSHRGLKGQLSNIEGNAQRVYALDSELAGEVYSSASPVGNFVEEYESIVSMADLDDSNKAAMFDTYRNFIANRGITDKATIDKVFLVLEEKYGEDLGPEFSQWLADPESFSEPSGQGLTQKPKISEVSSLDQLIADFAQTETERGKITGEQKKEKNWARNVDSQYNRFYSRAPSSLQGLFDGIYNKTPESVYSHGGEVDPTKGSDLTDEQWANIDDQVARTVSTMLQQPAPGLEEFGLSLGGTLLSNVGLADEDAARDLGKTGKDSAVGLLKEYAKYKEMVQEKPSFSPEVLKLMEKYGMGVPNQSLDQEEIGAQIDAGFGDAFSDLGGLYREMSREDMEIWNRKYADLKAREALDLFNNPDSISGGRNPFEVAPAGWETPNDRLDEFFRIPDDFTSYDTSLDSILDQGWGRNPFLPVEK